jgi:ferredoxin
MMSVCRHAVWWPGAGASGGIQHNKELRMAYKITDACTACGTCKETCPAGAISEGDPIFKIDPDTCIDCGACADACPVSAIEPE